MRITFHEVTLAPANVSNNTTSSITQIRVILHRLDYIRIHVTIIALAHHVFSFVLNLINFFFYY